MGFDSNGNWKIDGGVDDFTKVYGANAMAAEVAPKTTDWSKVFGTQEGADLLTKNLDATNKSFFDKAFDSPGSTIGGIGALVSGIGSLYAAKLTKDYQNKIVKMEEDRINDNKARQAKQQEAFNKVWG